MISIIIPTYNGANFLQKSLRTWANQTIDDYLYEVIVVDNNSAEDISSVVKTVKENVGRQTWNVKYVFEGKPGATNARHAGVRISKGDILVFADNDGLYNPEYLEEILKVYDQNPNCVAIACKIEIQWDGKEPEWITPYKYLLGHLDYGAQIGYSMDYYLNGGSMSVLKDTFERLGGFNPDLIGPYLIGDGDLGFVHKLHAEKAIIGWAPFAHMWHMQQVTKHGSEQGVALHCYNNGIADSYAKYRVNGFRINGALRKYICMRIGIVTKWLVMYYILRHRDRKTYFSMRQHVGELRFFTFLLKPELRAIIRKENVYYG